ncbi:AraC family transcriptional regulator [Falsiroseomonas selenitidurans]|uniref:Helix-turn-helix transcriptional regulator n=1 Tax=Falsiroseomonas selenitidurans TaxID=2716335 RepID=A0ABX1EBF5_9PROT|nr:AraC family transcriptional regulator [Falsiroseomonas selenitidurans]NKC34331.1 helix-turn-helix transcriptional regulator [Falsiroseomonas selenitidurans]
MTAALQGYIDWYERGRLAPYLREKRAAFASAAMFEAAQPAGDMSDPPASDLVLIRTVSSGIRHRSDFGAGRFEANSPAGAVFPVPPATATTIQVDVPHVIRSVCFPAALIRPQLEAARPGRDPFDFGRLHRGGLEDAHLVALLDRLWAEAGEADAASRLYAEGATIAIMGALLRAAGQVPKPARGGLAPWQLKRVQAAIEDRLAEDLGLAELAALVGLSPWHFCRAFRESTGLPPQRWQLARRVARAAELLLATELPVTEIAAAVGYDDPGQLATLFRKRLGTTPSRYRREHRA